MLDTKSIMEGRIQFYEKDIGKVGSVNNFDGEFQISSHTRIPEIFLELLMYNFKTARLRRVPIEDINAFLNEIWEGPGSVEKVIRLTYELGQTVGNLGPLDAPKKKLEVEDDGPVASYGSESFTPEAQVD
jgi:hypothetical protein